MAYLGQGIQEWNMLNMWKTAFKKFKVILSAYTEHKLLQMF